MKGGLIAVILSSALLDVSPCAAAVSALAADRSIITALRSDQGGGPARISRLPAWLAAPTTPSRSIFSIRDAARL